MRFLATRVGVLSVLAAAISATSAAPAMAQEWYATSKPVEVEGTITCTLALDHPDYAVLIGLAGDTPSLTIRSRFLVGVAHGTRSSLLRFPAGSSPRVTLNKDSTDSDVAKVEIDSDADLLTMIDGFAVSGDLTVTVLGGKPAAFRLSQLPTAARAIPIMQDCIEELNYS